MRVGGHIRQLATESVVYGISRTIVKFIGVLLIPIYTRVFDPSEYGIVALLDTLIALAGLSGILLADPAAVRWFYDSDDLKHRRAIMSCWFWYRLLASVAAAAVLILFARPISAVLCASDGYAHLVRLVALTLPLGTGSLILFDWLRFQRRAVAAVAFSIAATLTQIGLVILFVVVWHGGLGGLFAARVTAAILSMIVCVVILKNWLTPRAFSWRRLKEMLAFGLPLWPATIALWGILSVNRFILNVFCEKDEIGLFAIAASLASGVALVVRAFQKAYVPFVYSILQQEECKRVYARILDVYAFTACAACTAVALFAPLLLRVLTTEAYYGAASCVGFLAFTTALDGAKSIATVGSAIAKDLKLVAVGMGVGAAVNVGAAFLLVPIFGKEGAAAASMLGYAFTVVWLFAASQRSYHIPYRWHVSVSVVALSWGLMAVDRFCIPRMTVSTCMLRAGMLLTFLPLGMWLGLIRWANLKELLGVGVRGRHERFLHPSPKRTQVSGEGVDYVP